MFGILEKPIDKPVIEQLEQGRKTDGEESVTLHRKGDQHAKKSQQRSAKKLKRVPSCSDLTLIQIKVGEQEEHQSVHPALKSHMRVRMNQMLVLQRKRDMTCSP